MRRIFCALALLASLAAHAGQWAARAIMPFGPLMPLPAAVAPPGQITIQWDTPTVDEDGAPLAVDHYVMVYEQLGTYDVSFVDDVPGSSNTYTLTGLTSGARYAAWLEARGADGNTHAVTPLVLVTAP